MVAEGLDWKGRERWERGWVSDAGMEDGADLYGGVVYWREGSCVVR